MTDVLIVATEQEIAVYDKQLQNLKLDDIPEEAKVYVVLPDNVFFFFQTDIVAKKPTKPLQAFAQSNFPKYWDAIGYVKGTQPVVGYVVIKSRMPEDIMKFINKAQLITTPFMLAWAKGEDNFLYRGCYITACVEDGRLKYYGPEEDAECNSKKVIELKDTKVIAEVFRELLDNNGDLDKFLLVITQQKPLLEKFKPFLGWTAACFALFFHNLSRKFVSLQFILQ